MGAPPSSMAWAGLACECSPRPERTTTRLVSPTTLATLRITPSTKRGLGSLTRLALLPPSRATGASVFLAGKGRKTNRDGIQRRIGLGAGPLEVVDHGDEGERLTVTGLHVTRQRPDIRHRSRLRVDVVLPGGSLHPRGERSVDSGD